mmetsp:Transcript_73417/g.110756  ORF Transcript_73417/g.110756 Transcript_73417/m.110756 type:complete len:349 (-) Transcript_73417:1495-2541(-)
MKIVGVEVKLYPGDVTSMVAKDPSEAVKLKFPRKPLPPPPPVADSTPASVQFTPLSPTQLQGGSGPTTVPWMVQEQPVPPNDWYVTTSRTPLVILSTNMISSFTLMYLFERPVASTTARDSESTRASAASASVVLYSRGYANTSPGEAIVMLLPLGSIPLLPNSYPANGVVRVHRQLDVQLEKVPPQAVAYRTCGVTLPSRNALWNVRSPTPWVRKLNPDGLQPSMAVPPMVQLVPESAPVAVSIPPFTLGSVAPMKAMYTMLQTHEPPPTVVLLSAQPHDPDAAVPVTIKCGAAVVLNWPRLTSRIVAFTFFTKMYSFWILRNCPRRNLYSSATVMYRSVAVTSTVR